MKSTHDYKAGVQESRPKSLRGPRFNGDKKRHLDHFMLALEKIVIAALLPRVPLWMSTVHLTMMTIAWSAGVVVSGYLSGYDIRWLWASSFCILGQHITDMLDGAVGRARNTGLIKWGFYADHLLDYIFMCAIIGAYAFLLPSFYFPLVVTCLIVCGGLMVHVFLDFAITNDFKISFSRIGASELRWLVIMMNTLIIIFGRGVLIAAFPVIVLAALAAFIIVVYQSQLIYRRIDLGE